MLDPLQSKLGGSVALDIRLARRRPHACARNRQSVPRASIGSSPWQRNRCSRVECKVFAFASAPPAPAGYTHDTSSCRLIHQNLGAGSLLRRLLACHSPQIVVLRKRRESPDESVALGTAIAFLNSIFLPLRWQVSFLNLENHERQLSFVVESLHSFLPN